MSATVIQNLLCGRLVREDVAANVRGSAERAVSIRHANVDMLRPSAAGLSIEPVREVLERRLVLEREDVPRAAVADARAWAQGARCHHQRLRALQYNLQFVQACTTCTGNVIDLT